MSASHLIGQAKRGSDVALSGSMKLVSDPQTVIAHIVALRAERSRRTPAGAAAGTCPPNEVVKKGKKDEAPAAEEKGKKK